MLSSCEPVNGFLTMKSSLGKTSVKLEAVTEGSDSTEDNSISFYQSKTIKKQVKAISTRQCSKLENIPEKKIHSQRTVPSSCTKHCDAPLSDNSGTSSTHEQEVSDVDMAGMCARAEGPAATMSTPKHSEKEEKPVPVQRRRSVRSIGRTAKRRLFHPRKDKKTSTPPLSKPSTTDKIKRIVLRVSANDSDTGLKTAPPDSGPKQNQGTTSKKAWSWAKARYLMQSKTYDQSRFRFAGYKLHQCSFLNVDIKKFQRLIRVDTPADGGVGKSLFMKVVPKLIWDRQMDQMEKYHGEWVYNAENVVMDASVLAGLTDAGTSICPEFIGLVNIRSPLDRPTKTTSAIQYVAILTEYYGDDLSKSMENTDTEVKCSTDWQDDILRRILDLTFRLHDFGLFHLDLTPQNILIGGAGLKFIDFSKAVPAKSRYLRHQGCLERKTSAKDRSYPFESCEPTIAKNQYVPPECWAILERLDRLKIYDVLETIADREGADREPFYFSAVKAEFYQLGTLLFWVSAKGVIPWRKSTKNDRQYKELVESGKWDFKSYKSNDGCCPFRAWSRDKRSAFANLMHLDPKLRWTREQLEESGWYASLLRKEGEPLRDDSKKTFET